MVFGNVFNTSLLDYSDPRGAAADGFIIAYKKLLNIEIPGITDFKKICEDYLIDFQDYLIDFQAIINFSTNKSNHFTNRVPEQYPYIISFESNNGIDNFANRIHVVFKDLPEGHLPICDNDLKDFEFDPTKKQSDSENIIDLLGAYYTRTGFDNEGKQEPYIILDIKKIQEKYPSKEQQLNIATVVFIHELCHAVLDPNNYMDFACIGKEKTGVPIYKLVDPQIKYSTTYGCLKEEAIANAMAYRYIKQLGNDILLQDAEEFFSKQTGAYFYGYLLGIEKEQINPLDWIKEKIDGSDEKTQWTWLFSMAGTLKMACQNVGAGNNSTNFPVFNFFQEEDIRKICDTLGKSNNHDGVRLFQDLSKPYKMSINEYGIINITTPEKVSLDIAPQYKPFYFYLLIHPEGLTRSSFDECQTELLKCYKKIEPYSPNSKNVSKSQTEITFDPSEAKTRINDVLCDVLRDYPYTIHNYAVQTRKNGRNVTYYVNPPENKEIIEQVKKFFE